MHFDVVLHDDCGFEDLKLKARSIHGAMTWTQVLIYLHSGLARKKFRQNSVSDYSFWTDHGLWWVYLSVSTVIVRKPTQFSNVADWTVSVFKC